MMLTKTKLTQPGNRNEAIPNQRVVGMTDRQIVNGIDKDRRSLFIGHSFNKRPLSGSLASEAVWHRCTSIYIHIYIYIYIILADLQIVSSSMFIIQPEVQHAPTFIPPQQNPCQIAPSFWLGDSTVLSNRGFFESYPNVKMVILCTEALAVGRFFLHNNQVKLDPPEYCVLVVDPSFLYSRMQLSGSNHARQASSFIHKYALILRAIILLEPQAGASLDLSSPILLRKDTLSVVESIMGLIHLAQKNFSNTGVLIISDTESEVHHRIGTMLAVAYLLQNDSQMRVLDAMVRFRSFSPSLDTLYLNNGNFFDILNEYRSGLITNQRFQIDRQRSFRKGLKRGSIVPILPAKKCSTYI